MYCRPLSPWLPRSPRRPTDPLVQKRIDGNAAKDNRKAEKKEASFKRKEALATQGGMTQTPDSQGK